MVTQLKQETKTDIIKKLKRFLNSLPIEISMFYDKYSSEVYLSCNKDNRQYTFYLAKMTDQKKFIEGIRDTFEVYLPLVELREDRIIKKTADEIAEDLENGLTDFDTYKRVSSYRRYRLFRQQKNFKICYLRNLNNGSIEKYVLPREEAELLRKCIIDNQDTDFSKFFNKGSFKMYL